MLASQHDNYCPLNHKPRIEKQKNRSLLITLSVVFRAVEVAATFDEAEFEFGDEFSMFGVEVVAI